MEYLNNNTNLIENASEPYGLQFLRANHATEAEAVKQLTICCDQHPLGCDREAECKKQFDRRVESWPLQPYYEYHPRILNQDQRYIGWMPQLTRSAIIRLARERPIY